MLFLILASFFRERRSLVDENVLRLTVLPNDVDVTRLSSDRYLPLMDLGRVNILLRARLFWTLVRNRWVPVARVATIRYRYPLKMFQRFELRTRVVYWDAEWAWTEHRFVRKGRTTAIALVKVAFLGPEGVVPLEKLLAAAGESHASPPPSRLIAELQSVEEQLRRSHD
jgi:acyl-CoA thioesterase FadM